MKPTKEELIGTLKALAFVVESVAHLRGMESDLLPVADKANNLVGRLESCES